MESLILKPGGLLERRVWNGDIQDYEVSEVSDVAIFYLNDAIEFDNIVLRDLFLLIQKNIDLFLPVFNNWIEEYTNDAINKVPGPDLNFNNLEMLKLTWKLFESEGYRIGAWPDFDGHGYPSDEDCEIFTWYKKDELIAYGISLTKVEELANVPLVLDKNVHVYKADNSEELHESATFTLYQVIQAVVWELSWHGSPEGAQQHLDMIIKERITEAKEGRENLTPIEEVFKLD